MHITSPSDRAPCVSFRIVQDPPKWSRTETISRPRETPCSVHNSARHSPFKLPDGFSGHPCPFSGVRPSAASFGNDRFPLPPDYPAMAAVARPAATRLESIRCDRKSNPTLLRRERRTVSVMPRARFLEIFQNTPTFFLHGIVRASRAESLSILENE